MTIIIREASKDDVNKLVNIYNDWADFKDILPDDLIIPETEEGLSHHFDGEMERKYLLAVDDKDNPIGACYIELSDLCFSTVRLGDMMIKKEYRHQGAGSKLVDMVIKFAQENSCKKVWLWTQEELEPATKLYEKKGFILEGRIKKQFCGKDALLYGLVLS